VLWNVENEPYRDKLFKDKPFEDTVMSAAHALLTAQYCTEEEYLRREVLAHEKSEYIAGVVVAMAGGSLNNNSIAAQCIAALSGKLPKECRVLTSDMRVVSPVVAGYVYPDVSVVCGKPDIRTGQSLANPRVIVEVLSPATELRDRSDKLHVYMTIPSVQEILLIAQDKRSVELYCRTSSVTDRWEYLYNSASTITGGQNNDGQNNSGQAVELQSLGCVLRFDELYAQAEFDG